MSKTYCSTLNIAVSHCDENECVVWQWLHVWVSFSVLSSVFVYRLDRQSTNLKKWTIFMHFRLGSSICAMTRSSLFWLPCFFYDDDSFKTCVTVVDITFGMFWRKKESWEEKRIYTGFLTCQDRYSSIITYTLLTGTDICSKKEWWMETRTTRQRWLLFPSKLQTPVRNWSRGSGPPGIR